MIFFMYRACAIVKSSAFTYVMDLNSLVYPGLKPHLDRRGTFALKDRVDLHNEFRNPSMPTDGFANVNEAQSGIDVGTSRREGD